MFRLLLCAIAIAAIFLHSPVRQDDLVSKAELQAALSRAGEVADQAGGEAVRAAAVPLLARGAAHLSNVR